MWPIIKSKQNLEEGTGAVHATACDVHVRAGPLGHKWPAPLSASLNHWAIWEGVPAHIYSGVDIHILCIGLQHVGLQESYIKCLANYHDLVMPIKFGCSKSTKDIFLLKFKVLFSGGPNSSLRPNAHYHSSGQSEWQLHVQSRRPERNAQWTFVFCSIKFEHLFLNS